MYNRYIRGSGGQYRRVPVPDPPQPGPPPGPPPPGPPPGPPPPGPPPEGGGYQPFSHSGGPRYGYSSGGGPQEGPPPPKGEGFLSGILRRLNLENIDTGDLLLILILILLFKDGEDEEMLIALGLMLIL